MRKRVFDDKQRLVEMLQKRESGFSFGAIASVYGIDHTTVIYWCRKYNVQKKVELPRRKPTFKEKILPPPRPPHKYEHLWLEKTRPAKSYKEYLLESKQKVCHTNHQEKHQKDTFYQKNQEESTSQVLVRQFITNQQSKQNEHQEQ